MRIEEQSQVNGKRDRSRPNERCPRCHDTGSVWLPSGDLEQCICSLRAMVRLRLGPALSPYHRRLERPALVTPDLSLTRESVHLLGLWDDVAPQVAYVLGLRIWFAVPDIYEPRVVTDEELKRAFFAKTDKYDDSALDLHGLVGERLPMVVIRLGFLGHKHPSMPGILLEALKIREAKCLPTWILDDPREPFREGHFAFDKGVAGYIQRTFRKITIPGDDHE